MSDEYSYFKGAITIVFLVVIAFVAGNIFSNPKVGTTYHGIVVQEICNQNSQSYVLIEISNQTSQTRNYKIEYSICLDFLFHHGKGVTITDDAWFDRIAVYRWD